MEYSNPEIPEGINTTQEHPLKEFFILLTGILVTIAVAVAVLGIMAEKLAIYIPFQVEKDLLSGEDLSTNEKHSDIVAYLKNLSDQVTDHMDLPEDMSITIHYLDQDIKNAYATLGGHIYIYRGLFSMLPSENALSMVIAHEIAHIKHRHPIIALGRGVVIGLFLATIAGLSGDHFVGQVVNDTGIITLLSFNRRQEQEADITALKAVADHYGHINGSGDFFESLLRLDKKFSVNPPEFLSTHPLGKKRLAHIKQLAKDNRWMTTGELIMLPEIIQKAGNNTKVENPE